MATSKKDTVEKARRRVDKQRRKLDAALEDHAQTRERGKQEIERARLQAAEWLAEVSERVDRRSAKLARAEEHLANLLKETSALDGAVVDHRDAQTPEETVEILREQRASEEPASPIILPTEGAGEQEPV